MSYTDEGGAPLELAERIRLQRKREEEKAKVKEDLGVEAGKKDIEEYESYKVPTHEDPIVMIEKGFKSTIGGMRERSYETLEQARQLKAQGKDVAAGVYVSIYTAKRVGTGALEGLTLPLRPIAMIETGKTVVGLATSAVKRTEFVEAVKRDPVGFVGEGAGAFLGASLFQRAIATGRQVYTKRRYLTDLPDEAFTPYDDAVLQAIPEEVTYTTKEPQFILETTKITGESPFKFKDDLGGFKPTHVKSGETIGRSRTGLASRLIYKELGTSDIKPIEPMTIIKSTAVEVVQTPKVIIEMKAAAAPRSAHLPSVWTKPVEVLYDQPGPGSLFYSRLGAIGASIPKPHTIKTTKILPSTYTPKQPSHVYSADPITRMESSTRKRIRTELRDIMVQTPSIIPQIVPIHPPIPDVKPKPVIIPRVIPQTTPVVVPQMSLRPVSIRVQKQILPQKPMQTQKQREVSVHVPRISYRQLEDPTRALRQRLKKRKRDLMGPFDLDIWGEKRKYPVKDPKIVLKDFGI